MHVLHELNHQGITIIMTTHEINAVAVHLPWIVCMNGRVLAEGPPAEVITSETLMLTYGADMPVIHYQGMTLVAESPHAYGRKVEEPDPQLEPVQINGTDRKTEVGHGHGHPHDHEHDQLADLDQPSVAPVSADADADAGEPVPAPDTEQEIKYV